MPMYAPVPDGQVKILRGVPLDSSYNNTIYFSSLSAQSTYFAGLAKYSYTQLMYIRETRKLRIPLSGDTVFDCNYLMYKNTQYADKWFYAFINQVYYINDNCCEIEFEIDVMQTWALDYELKPSYIERNHTVTDVIGENRVPENLDIGSYITRSRTKAWYDNGANLWDVVAFSTFDWSTWQKTSGDIIYGIYSGLTRTTLGQISVSGSFTGTMSYAWITDARPKITDLLNNHADLVEGVVAIILTPHNLESGFVDKSITRPGSTWALDGYIPRNKKIWTAPFCVLYVTDTSGSGKVYAFEDFEGAPGSGVTFRFYTDKAACQTVIGVPLAYKGSGTTLGTAQPNFEEAIFITGYPQCPWVSDAYKTYLAQNGSNLLLSQVLGAGQVVAGAALTVFSEGAGAPIGIGLMTSGVSAIAGQIADQQDKSKTPPRAHGNSTGSAFISINEKVPALLIMQPRKEQAIIIDQYFDKYGYAIHKVDVPNISSRPHWNYVKTVDANILPKSGTGLPASDLKKIVQIFDRGITFWKNGSEVGDYTLDNRPS